MLTRSFAGIYSVTTIYAPGDLVVFSGKLYQAQSQNLGASPLLNPSVWSLVASNLTWSGAFLPGLTYSLGQIVTYNNNSFISLSNINVGQQPDISPNWWRVFSNTSPSITLQAGDLQYQGNTFIQRLPIGNTNQVLTVSNTGLPVWANTFGLPADLTVANSFTTNFITANTATVSGNITIGGTLSAGILTANTVAYNQLTSNTYQYNNGEAVGYIYALDNISPDFDGVTTTFPLTYNNGTAAYPNNPNQLRIVIGNNDVLPTTQLYDYQNLTEINLFNSGFIITGNTVTFATAPLRGMSFYGTFRTSQDLMPTFNFYQTPFTPLNIMLGP